MDRRQFFALGAAAAAAPLLLPRSALASIPLITHGEFAKTHTTKNDMFFNWRRVQQFTIGLKVDRPARMRLGFNACVRLADFMERMSAYAISAGLRGPAAADVWPGTEDPFWGRPPEIPGCFVRANIMSNLVTYPSGQTDRYKYDTPAFSTVHKITDPGFYRVEIWARARSSWNVGGATNWDNTGTPNPGGDGNVAFDQDPYDAYDPNFPANNTVVTAITYPQNQLVVELD
ncbi:hypothetical protein [Bosea sp. FBZP-16]|uniref:hypothetical protein n=1 Tax=Bosea sp. FBZP-16 TaxID=2065382 RepID=UPI000C31A44F|nr:hypothetical protein [Bosea sp. FBZP-16]